MLAATWMAAVLLAGCNASVVTTNVTGVPSLGLSVPLHTVACTTTGSCVALGTTGSDLAPSSVGEYRQANGTWSSLVVPSAPSSVITTASCWSTGCLVGGVQPSGAMLWNYNASSQSIDTVASAPTGQGVRALSCFGEASCAAIIDTGVDAESFLTFSADGGGSWTSRVPLAWSLDETVTDLACTDPLDCMVSAVTPANTLDLEVTHDAGATWRVRPTPSSWTSLTSLTCRALDCVGLAATSGTSTLVRTGTFGRGWRTTTLHARANALACSTIRRCVVGGQRTDGSPWLATFNDGALDVASLTYVPSPIVDVACATKVCVAIGVSTVLAMRP